MRILVVDDSELVRRVVKDLLTAGTSWEVCGEATNGAEALQKVQMLRPDAVLLDISMPGADGLETARLLRDAHPDVKIVIMSQHDAAVLQKSASEAGANGCVDKAHISVESLEAILSGPRK